MKMDKGEETILGKLWCYALRCIHRNRNAIFWSECLYGSEEERQRTIHPKSLYLQRKKTGVSVECYLKPSAQYLMQIPSVHGCALGLQS